MVLIKPQYPRIIATTTTINTQCDQMPDSADILNSLAASFAEFSSHTELYDPELPKALVLNIMSGCFQAPAPPTTRSWGVRSATMITAATRTSPSPRPSHPGPNTGPQTPVVRLSQGGERIFSTTWVLGSSLR